MRVVRIALAGAAFVLAGCLDGGLVSFLAPVTTSAPITQIIMFSGDVVAVGPNGYCAALSASRPNTGFAIFTSCPALNGSAVAIIGIVTVQIGQHGSALVEKHAVELAAVLQGVSGPIILARDGDTSTVMVKQVIQADARVSVYFDDDAPAAIYGTQEAEWRSFIDVNDRLVTVSVRGFDLAPLSARDGTTLLDQAVDVLIAANK